MLNLWFSKSQADAIRAIPLSNGRKNVGSSSSRAPQVKSTSQPTQPTRTSNKVTSTTQPNQPSQTTQPTRTSNKVKSTSKPTPSSSRSTTRSLSQGKESTHLPPPHYLLAIQDLKGQQARYVNFWSLASLIFASADGESGNLYGFDTYFAT
ncbi:hypothetical protein ACFE04_022267 [Oxalis oulophora]